ncbi:MAG TPA: NHL repeat-containing protein [Candidatus Acidoferrum sp.]|nr:NHL repeat-containing protein [Candidatus Acidoferrum sp.]
MNRARTAASCFALAALCACSGPSSQSQVIGSESAAERGPAHAARRDTTSGPTVYIIGNTIAAYDTATLRLLRTYEGVYIPGGAAQDAAGDLYVSDFQNNDVVEFQAGQTRIVQNFAQGMSQPTALAFDSFGNLYVANAGPVSNGGNSVTVYNSSGALIRAITNGIQHPTQLAFDSQGNLYVSNLGGPTTIYANGQTTLTGSISQVTGSTAILLDSSDDVYVANCNFRCAHGLVYEFGPQGKPLLRKISTGIRNPYDLALDAYGNLFVANANVNGNERCYVSAYVPGATSPFEMISDGVRDARAVGFDSSGNLYVANYRSVCEGNRPSGNGSVTIYPPGSTQYAHKLTRGVVRPQSLLFGI